MEGDDSRPRFVVEIHKTPGGYFARALDVPGCIAKGESEVEALENVRVAIRTFLAVASLIEHHKARVSLEISA
jgi:predicted RNase H-like HicB family nuclease